MSLKKIALCLVFVLFIAVFCNTNTASAEETVEVFDTLSLIEESQNAPSTVEDVDNNTIYTDTVEVPDEEQTEEIKIKAGNASDKDKSKKKKKKAKYTKAELRLMSAIIYCESNSEPYAGKLAVGIVVMNRVESSAFPNTVNGVIYQRSQFSPARNGTLKRALARYDAGKFVSKNEKQCIKAAKAALNGTKKVSYNGKVKNLSTYKFFSGYISGARYRIAGHMFK